MINRLNTSSLALFFLSNTWTLELAPPEGVARWHSQKKQSTYFARTKPRFNVNTVFKKTHWHTNQRTFVPNLNGPDLTMWGNAKSIYIYINMYGISILFKKLIQQKRSQSENTWNMIVDRKFFAPKQKKGNRTHMFKSWHLGYNIPTYWIDGSIFLEPIHDFCFLRPASHIKLFPHFCWE